MKCGTQRRDTEEDNRLGLTFVYNPYTEEKSFRISDWSDDIRWAETFQDLVTTMYPNAERIHVVVCGEDIEKMATLERICTPEEALEKDAKLETHVVPTNGRWLNFAENEAISVCKQCLKDGVFSVEQLAEHLASWQRKRTFVDFKLTLNRFREVFSWFTDRLILHCINIFARIINCKKVVILEIYLHFV